MTKTNPRFQVRLKTRWFLVVLVINALLVLRVNCRTYNCTFILDENKQPIVPSTGNCRGPLDYTIEKRRVITALNRGCPMNKVPISTSQGSFSTEVKCGDCVPGTHGNYAFFNQDYVRIVTKDSTTVMKITDDLQFLYSSNRFTGTCPFNHYCTAEGKCAHMRTLPNYLAACKTSVAPISEETLTCGGMGLRCLDGKCKVCDDNSAVVRPLRAQLTSVDPKQIRTWIPAYCIAGEYVTKDDVRAFWNVYHLDCILYLILFVLIVSKQTLFSTVRFLSKRSGINQCVRMFSMAHWEKKVEDAIFKPLDEMEAMEKRKQRLELLRKRRMSERNEQVELNFDSP